MANHVERLHLKYTPTQLFDLVADVERYPEFLPWVIATRIRCREDRTVWVDMTIGTRFLCREFSTVALLDRPRRIDISSHDPLVDRFEQTWNFEPVAEGGTNLEYHVDFGLPSGPLQALIGASFTDRAAMMVDAFRHRARLLYGAPWSPDLMPR